MLLMFLACLASVAVVFGYFIIRINKVQYYLGAVFITAILHLILKVTITVTVLEYTSDYKLEKKLAIGAPLYKATDTQEMIARRGGKYLYINSSNTDMYIVPVVYGTTYKESRIDVLNAHTHMFYNEDIDYKPGQVPPAEIQVSGGGGQTKYWFTTKEAYIKEFPEGAEMFEDED